jgi:hypothetical protein
MHSTTATATPRQLCNKHGHSHASVMQWPAAALQTVPRLQQLAKKIERHEHMVHAWNTPCVRRSSRYQLDFLVSFGALSDSSTSRHHELVDPAGWLGPIKYTTSPPT